jgi:tetratricopeptide (TPR) repeat protein
MKPSSRNTMMLVVSCFFMLFFSACSVYDPFADFVGQRYTNVISYFNTYYNAQRAFSEAETDVMTARRAALVKKPQAIPSYPVSSTARQKFNTAIEKGSRLLSYYPTCKWVDYTLLMIGVSYYYLEDDLKAERKFQELLAKFPESSVIPEAELWYGRSLLRQKKIEDGLKRLNGLVERSSQVGREIAGEAAFGIGAYYYGIPDYVTAAIFFDKAAALETDDDAKAQADLFAGLCADQLGDYMKAEMLFRNSRSDASEYNQKFEGELQATRMIIKQKRYEEAVRSLTLYLRDIKNSDFYSRIHLMIGQVAMEQERYDEGLAKFTFVDTTFARTDESAHAYFAQARYFEFVRDDYARARINYEKAKLEFSGSEVVEEAARKSEIYSRYFQITRTAARYDSLVTDMLNPRKDTVRADTLSKKTSKDTLSKNAHADSLSQRPAKIITAAMRDSLRADSVKMAGMWQAKLDSLQKMRVRTNQELAGLFYLELQRPDSAVYWYNRVIAGDKTGEFTPRSLFVLADLRRAPGNADSSNVDSLYNRILADYPVSLYAQEVRKMRNLPLRQPERDLAKEIYQSAERCIDAGRTDSAQIFLARVVKQYPSSLFGAKALYTAGWLYENDPLRRDSASAIYRRLLVQYPLSLYGQKVQPKIAAEDQERLQAEQARQKVTADSLAAVKAIADSIAATQPKSDTVSSTRMQLDSSKTAPQTVKHAAPFSRPLSADSTKANIATPADTVRKNPFIRSPRQE